MTTLPLKQFKPEAIQDVLSKLIAKMFVIDLEKSKSEICVTSVTNTFILATLISTLEVLQKKQNGDIIKIYEVQNLIVKYIFSVILFSVKWIK